MLTISLASPVPIHDQLVVGLRGLIASGKLAEGDELPPVRQLAADLGICGAIFGTWMMVERARIAEVRARLDAAGASAAE